MRKLNISLEDDRKLLISDLKKHFTADNINVLFGAGFSAAVLGVLESFEQELTQAISEGNIENETKVYKDFFKKCMLPLNNTSSIKKGENARLSTVAYIAEIINSRHSSILHKIINIFTTNYDDLIEDALEKACVEYSDGFSGRMPAIFSTSNYGKVILKQSSVANRFAEIVTANVYKLHGSLTWLKNGENIEYSNCRNKIKILNEVLDTSNFLEEYKKSFAIINPNNDKFDTTVLQSVYYDQLRYFSNELDKHNTLLLVQGFSFKDKHIKLIIDRALMNPTLSMCVFAYSQQDVNFCEELFNKQNITIIYREEKDDESNIVSDKLLLDDVSAILREILDAVK